MGLAEIKWSFFSRASRYKQKRFLTNSLLLCSVCGEQARGAVAELGEASARGPPLGDGVGLGVAVARAVAVAVAVGVGVGVRRLQAPGSQPSLATLS